MHRKEVKLNDAEFEALNRLAIERRKPRSRSLPHAKLIREGIHRIPGFKQALQQVKRDTPNHADSKETTHHPDTAS